MMMLERYLVLHAKLGQSLPLLGRLGEVARLALQSRRCLPHLTATIRFRRILLKKQVQ
jgi:hypothetical protein